MNRILLILSLISVSACTTTETPVPKRAETTAQVSLGADYDAQVFYSLAAGKEVGRNERTDWDLAFESAVDGYRVYLNSAKFMFAWNTGQTSFDAVTDTAGYAMARKMESSSGLADSTAVGDWRNQNTVYLIDRGVTSSGSFGFMKVKFLEVTESTYTIEFQELSGTEVYRLTVNKDELANSSFVSFDNGGKQVSVEPAKDKWDICFTQYSVEIPIPYMVTGVLTNRYKTYAHLVMDRDFASIDLAYAETIEFDSRIDNIGYEWKFFDFETNSYVVDSKLVYLIKTSEGFYYKLHFVDFYSETGEKGNPKWIAQRL